MKLSPLTIIILGLSVAIMAFGIGLSRYIPNMEEAQMQREYGDQLITEANKQRAANQRVEKAIAKVNAMAAQWQTVVAQKTPPQDVRQGGINLSVNRWQLVHDVVDFRNSVQRAVNAQIRRGGVTVVRGPTIPDPPTSAGQVVEGYFNYPAIKFPVVIFDLGRVTVRGTYSQVLENMRSWSSMPNYLAVADGLTLTGTSPEITGSYAVTLVAFIRGDKISPPVPEGGVTLGGPVEGVTQAPGGAPGVPGGPPGRGQRID
jgi:hypothetical protein